MASRRRGRRGRSRKQQPSAGERQVTVGTQPPPGKRKPRGGGAQADRQAADAPRTLGAGGPPRSDKSARPQAPWHPLPLAELLIFVGVVVIAIDVLSHGVPQGPPSHAIMAGAGAVAIGTIEVTWREHFGGYRSHTILLAVLPAVVFHSAVVLGLSIFMRVPRTLTSGLLAADVVIAAVLFRLLRARFLDARVRARARRS